MNAITQDLLIKLEMGKKKAIRLGKVMPPLKSEVKKTKVYHYIMDHKQTREGAALLKRISGPFLSEVTKIWQPRTRSIALGSRGSLPPAAFLLKENMGLKIEIIFSNSKQIF